jgi:hypothetical protein
MNFELSAPVAPFDDKSQASAVQRQYRTTSYKTFICLFLTLRVVFQEKNKKNNKRKHAIKNSFLKFILSVSLLFSLYHFISASVSVFFCNFLLLHVMSLM